MPRIFCGLMSLMENKIVHIDVMKYLMYMVVD